MSVRLRILNFGCRVVGKPRLRYVKRPGSQRKDFDYVGWVFGGRATGLSERDCAGHPPYRIVEREGGGHATILYFHGGGYIAGSPQSHSGLIRGLARRTGCRVVAPDYALGPEFPLPAAQNDARASWDMLVSEGTRPDRIVLAGDSAGGAMALSLMAELGAEGTRPAGCVAFCPWTDLTGSGASMAENAKADPLLPAERLPDLIGFATSPDTDLSDPRISPLFATFHDPAPTLIQYSETEVVRDDATRMAEVLRLAGGDVTLQSWPTPPHAWHVFGEVLPEARDALDKAAVFIDRCLDLTGGD